MKRLLGSPLRRALRLGGLVGRVATSVAGERLASIARSEQTRKGKRDENLVKNATRVVETLGELKGAAMKVGQMLSLQESILPPEVAAVLRTLQKQTPPMPFEVVEREIRRQLPDGGRLIASIEPQAFAAASIGQVHRARLADGRDVAIKVQYPGIDQVIEADLATLRQVLKRLVALFVEVDFDPIWRELRARLLEELDYLREVESIRRMAALHADVRDIVIPSVVEELTTRNVLTMEYVRGLPPDDACSDRVSQGARDHWGGVLFEFLLRGLLVHRFLHADPNLSNFAFLADGRVVVYDFGCVKEVPARIAKGYRAVCRAVLDGRMHDVAGAIAAIGFVDAAGKPLPDEMVVPWVEVFSRLLDVPGGYRFGDESLVYERLFELGTDNVKSGVKMKVPRDVVFVNRTLAGHFGNLSRLRARGDWRARVAKFAAEA